MPLHIDDYEADTQHLTLEQDGAYMRLLRTCWRNGWLPDDDFKLAVICGVTKTHWLRRLAPAIRPFFHSTAPGKISQKRLEKERENAAKISEKRAENARKRYENPPPVSNEYNDLDSANASGLHEHLPVQVQKQVQGQREESINPVPVPPDISIDRLIFDVSTLHGDADPDQAEQAPSFSGGRAKFPHLRDPAYRWVALGMSLDKNAVRGRTDDGRECVYVGDPKSRCDLYLKARLVAQAARKPEEWRGDWNVLVDWMKAGYSVEDVIVPAIQQVAATPKYGNVASLRYFQNAVYEHSLKKNAA